MNLSELIDALIQLESKLSKGKKVEVPVFIENKENYKISLCKNKETGEVERIILH